MSGTEGDDKAFSVVAGPQAQRRAQALHTMQASKYSNKSGIG
jgi:hypothetical protein